MSRDKKNIKYRTVSFFIIFVSVIFSHTVKSQNLDIFNEGKSAYESEKYQEAITTWMRILKSGEHSSALYYNIANAHYKLNEIAPSIYYYEKALQLSPNDKDILNNLVFAKNTTIDAIEPLPKTFFTKWDYSLSNWLTYNGWAKVSIVAVFLFMILFLSYYFSINTYKKRIFFAGSLLTILVLIVSLFMSFRVFKNNQENRSAIIFAESVEIRESPKLGSESVFSLHEGTKVKVLNFDRDWCLIQIVDGRNGWMPVVSLKML